MINVFKKFVKGLVLEGQPSDPTDNIEGSEWSRSDTNRFKGYIQGAVREFTTNDQAQTLTNKSMDGGANTFTNIPASALGTGIPATSIADGSVDNSEFQRLNGVTSSVVGINDTQTLTNKTLTTPVIDIETLTEQGSSPSNPSAGSLKVYAKTDNQLYSLNSSGVEKLVGSSGGDPSYKLVGGGILSITSSGGSNTPIASNLSFGGGGLGIMSATNEFQAQTFQASSSGTLSQVTFRMVKNIGGSLSGNMVVKVYTDNSGQPGTLLATSSGVNASVLTTSSADINFAFSGGPTLSTLTTYWAVMNTSSVSFSGGAEVIIKQNSANSYPNGSNYLSTDGGATFFLIGANYDLIFEVDTATGGNPALAFTSSLFLEKGGLAYADNTITTGQSPIVFPSDLNVAYVTPNLTTGGPNLTVTVGTLGSVPSTAFIIARRFGTEILVDNRVFTQLNLNGEKINNAADPTSPQDVATKNYVDTTAGTSNANKNLSNLNSPTAINQDLLPASDNTINLGSSSERYSQAQIRDIRYGANDAFDVQNRLLSNTAGGAMVDFSTAGTIDAKTNKISNVVDPVSAQDASTKAYADTKLAKAGGTMTGAIDMGSHQINNVTDPTLAQDAATKAYVDNNAGSKNYIINKGAEVDTSGWATYADAPGAVPVDGTGGSPTITFVRSTSSPLRGVGSFVFTKNVANEQGQGFSYDFTIDNADQAKVLSISFDYASLTGVNALLDNDLAVYIYDKTNGVIIQPSGFNILTAKQNLPIKKVATFQTASNSTSYRLIVHLASTNGNSWAVKFDNFQVGPQVVEYGAVITDWRSFTPTGSWTTNTTYTGQYRRVGGDMEVEATLSFSGTPDNTPLTVNLPAGYTIDTTRLPSNLDAYHPLGLATMFQGGGNAFFLKVEYSSTTAVNVFAMITSGAYGQEAGLSNSIPSSYVNGDKFGIKYKVPILGWDSTVQVSNDTDTRVVTASIGQTSNVSPTTDSIIIFDTPIFDTHNAYSTGTGLYTCPVSGFYNVDVVTQVSTATVIYIKVNGINVGFIYNVGTAAINSGSQIVKCKANDTIGIYTQTATTITGNSPYVTTLNIQRLSGPSQIAASESVNAKYFSDAVGRSASTSLPLQFPTLNYDSHGAVTTGSGWKFTAPISGIYRVSATGSIGGAATAGITIYVNGVGSTMLDQWSNSGNSNGAQSVKLLAGDYIDLRPGVSVTFGSDTTHAICIERVGN